MTGRDPFGSGSAEFRVVVNAEQQYALWPAGIRIPAGWEQAGGPGSAGECRELVERLWTDLRPESARAQEGGPGPPTRTVPELVREQAARTPDALAVISEDERLSYGELMARADRLAHRLREFGVRAESVVAVCLDRTPDLVVALLGVLAGGGAFLPLDPVAPRQRLARLVAETEAPVIVSSRDHAPKFAGSRSRVVDMQDLRAPGPRPEPPRSGPRPQDLAYVIYTSGSTGPPKGIMVGHSALARSLTAVTSEYRLTPEDRVLHSAALGFDTALEQMFGALTNGAALVLAGPHTWAPTDLAQRIPEFGVTVADLTPASWVRLLGLLGHGRTRLSSLRQVIVGGEIVHAKDCRTHLHELPLARLVNAYGLTETAITSTLCDLTRTVLAAPDTAGAPVGRPVEGVHVHVLDERLRPVPPGERGEIWIGGDNLARGIWRQPGQTAQQFLPDPYGTGPGERMYRTGDLGRWRPDGNLEVLGRVDDQLKIRGFRVDPAEIEAALVSHPEVGQALVVARERGTGDRDLVAYYTPAAAWPDRPEPGVLRDRLRSALRETLPGYMVPASFNAVEELPLAPSGKVDRKAVPRLAASAEPQAEAGPRQVWEGMGHLWSQILGVDTVHPHDDFFELGGNSLLAMEMLARARVMFGIGVTQIRDLTRALLRHSTLSAFAEAARRARAGSLDEAEPNAVDFAAEAQLGAALDGLAGPEGKTPPGGAAPLPQGDVLLTGATGFCGAHMIRELLRRTTGRIFCLVRAPDQEHGLERLRAGYQRHLFTDLTSPRVQPVLGDLGKPELGLRPAEFRRLGATVDAIYHFGGQVNFIYPYQDLRAANVDGTREIIRLAAQRSIPVHFTSSMAVLAGFGPAGVRRVTEQTPLDYADYLSVGYVETKWVGEELLRKASAAGLPVAVYRLMDVTGARGTGVLNTSSELSALFGYIAESGTCPDVRIPLDLLPADCFTEALGHIATHRPARGEVYHLTNPRAALVDSLADRLRSRGREVERVPYADWVARLVKYAAGHPTDPIAPFVPLFVDRCGRADLTVSEMYFEDVFPEFTRGNAERALDGSGVEIPPVDAGMLDSHLDFLQLGGAPAVPAGSALSAGGS